MSVNFSQNPQYINNPNNFNGNGPIAEPPLVDAMANSMDLPTKPADLPYLAGGIGFSLLVSKLANLMSRVNPKKNPNITIGETFDRSAVNKFSQTIENKITNPIATKYSTQIQATGGFLKKYTPKWIKNAFEKMKIGVMPKLPLAQNQCHGLSGQSINYFFDDILGNLPKDALSKLGLDKILQNTPNTVKARTEAFNSIAKALDGINVNDPRITQALTVPRKGWIAKIFKLKPKQIDLISEYNKTKTFMAPNVQGKVAKGLQKFLIGSTETAGGAVIGGTFGMLMNAVFVASALKRTWNAPKEDKFSTFAEAVFVDFIGQVYMMFLATKLSYKLFGLKNIDKTPNQIKRITQLLKAIENKKTGIKELNQIMNAVKSGQITDEITQLIAKHKLKPDQLSFEALKTLNAKSVSKVNRAIDRLAKAKKLQNNGFFKNLINRPIKWAGDFMSMGLETVPAKLKEVGKVSGFKAGWQKFANKLKGFGGGTLRFFFIMTFLAPLLTKPIIKLTHAIFGKPKKSYYDYVYEEEAKKKNADKPNTQNPQKISMDDFMKVTQLTAAMRAQQEPKKYPQNYNPQISETLIEGAKNAHKNRTSAAEKNKNKDTATYIPSVIPSQFTDTTLSNTLNQKLAFSDKIENYVNRELTSINIKNPYEF